MAQDRLSSLNSCKSSKVAVVRKMEPEAKMMLMVIKSSNSSRTSQVEISKNKMKIYHLVSTSANREEKKFWSPCGLKTKK